MDNAVGSLELPIILRARKNLSLALTETQKNILIGCILGDGHIQPKGKVIIEQSAKQKEYLMWKYAELKNLAYSAMPREIVRKDKRNSKEYHSFVFYLRQYFRPWREIFYSGNKKIFPEKLYLSPQSLAVWYMDDGSWSDKRCIISTESFGEASRKVIQNSLYEQFSLETVIRSNKKLLVRQNSVNKFCELVSPYIIPSMKYKVPNPVTTFSHRERSKV